MLTPKRVLVLRLPLLMLLAAGCDGTDPAPHDSLLDEGPALAEAQAAKGGAPLRKEVDVFVTRAVDGMGFTATSHW